MPSSAEPHDRPDGRQAAGQAAAASDQVAANRDQTSADIDQSAADLDQVASDKDLASGGDVATHRATRDIREHTAEQRGRSARARLLSAADRDETARRRDVRAGERDRAAAARDEALGRADDEELLAPREPDDPDGSAPTARARHRRPAGPPSRAAVARVHAARDRQAAAEDREQAADERMLAREDQLLLSDQLSAAETDQVTGARVRSAGLNDLGHELDRCRRTGRPLVVAYVDVVGLKAVNDVEGHAAGDGLLRRVVGAMRDSLRTYDLVVRLGGDEFLCVMSDVTLREAHERFDAIATSLVPRPGTQAIRTGFAQAGRDEDVTRLVGRADAEMIRDGGGRRPDERAAEVGSPP